MQRRCVLLPNFTKNAIKSSFMKLLNSTPFDNITVKNIVDDCGINRNTFYYNFDDIYALVDEILRDESGKIAEGHMPHMSWSDALLQAADFALKNKRAVFNLYNSSKRVQLEKYLQNVITRAVGDFVREEAKGENICESDICFVADFYSGALLGLINRWLDSGMQGDIEAIIEKTGLLFDGNIKQALKIISQAD